MRVEQLIFSSNGSRNDNTVISLGDKAQFVLIFGDKGLVLRREIFNELRNLYPNSYLIGCTTAGEIYENRAENETLSATAVCMENTHVKFVSAEIRHAGDCYDVAAGIAAQLRDNDLKHVFVLSEGIVVNGSSLVQGFRDNLPQEVTLSGGLSGDSTRFEETLIIANDYPRPNQVAVIAFYGEGIRVGCGFGGGWDSFGIERLVTKSDKNILYEMDKLPALDLYKKYLGEYAEGLPSTGLHFPLYLRSGDCKYSFVRTLLGINEKEKSLIFAGDIPEGYYAKLMMANKNNLIDGASAAAEASLQTLNDSKSSLTILISCVGRKLVLGQMIDEEVEAARKVLGHDSIFTGFYSYGEISPSVENQITCELHNQTMTITVLSEV